MVRMETNNTFQVNKLDIVQDKQNKEFYEEIDLKLGSVSKKCQSTPATTKFKFEGNSRLHEFNSTRLEEIAQCKLVLERSYISSALKILDDTEKALKERNKIIRIADKYGWDVVKEYQDDPLTENSEDATRLKQAEYRAKIKRREKATEVVRMHQSPYLRIESSKDIPPSPDLFRRSSVSLTERVPRGPSSTSGSTYGINVFSQSEYYGNSKQTETRCYYCNDAYECPIKASKFPQRSSDTELSEAHDHEPDKALVTSGKVSNEAKRALEDDPTRPFKRTFNEIVAEFADVSDEEDLELPSFSSLRSRLQRARSACLPPLPENIDDVDNRGSWRDNWSDDRFLSLLDNNGGIAFFCTERNFTILQTCDTIFIDGTFKACPRPYTSLYLYTERIWDRF